MRTLLLSFAIILLFSCESCDNDPKPKTELEKLPPMTQSGKNTFGCLVNGKAWITKTSIDAVAFYQSGLFQIGAQIEEPDREQVIGLTISNGVVANFSYDLSNDPVHEATFSWILENGICFYEGENTLSGSLTLFELDESKRIASGIFEFVTVNDECDTIKVTDGRFDVTYAN